MYSTSRHPHGQIIAAQNGASRLPTTYKVSGAISPKSGRSST
ncbi:MAG: hypothetical protein AB7T06_26175 [Kofleriaceae bacterium]